MRCLVSAAKTIAVLEQQPPWTDRDDPLPLPTDSELVEEQSGFVARPGELTVVVSGDPEEMARLADRLGRYLQVRREPISMDIGEKLKGRAARRARRERVAALRQASIRDRASADGTWGVRLGSVDLGDAALADVRATILVSDTGSRVFAGTLQSAIDPAPPTRPRAGRAGPLCRCRRRRLGRGSRTAGRAGSTRVAEGCPVDNGSGWCWPAPSPPIRRS